MKRSERLAMVCKMGSSRLFVSQSAIRWWLERFTLYKFPFEDNIHLPPSSTRDWRLCSELCFAAVTPTQVRPGLCFRYVHDGKLPSLPYDHLQHTPGRFGLSRSSPISRESRHPCPIRATKHWHLDKPHLTKDNIYDTFNRLTLEPRRSCVCRSRCLFHLRMFSSRTVKVYSSADRPRIRRKRTLFQLYLREEGQLQYISRYKLRCSTLLNKGRRHRARKTDRDMRGRTGETEHRVQLMSVSA